MDPERKRLADERAAQAANIAQIEYEEDDECRSILSTKQEHSMLRKQQKVLYKLQLINSQRRLGMVARINYRRQNR